MEWIRTILHLPPIGHETGLHIDLASAAIALLALLFSIWTWRHQDRVRKDSLLAQRDLGMIRWIDLTIDTIVDIEFSLRSWTASANPAQSSMQRDNHLAKLAAVIDKGRLYFPKFTRDVIGPQTEPAPEPDPGQIEKQIKLPLLDDLAEIYRLTNEVTFQSEVEVKNAQHAVMMTKLDFIKMAQQQVEFRRVPENHQRIAAQQTGHIREHAFPLPRRLGRATHRDSNIMRAGR